MLNLFKKHGGYQCIYFTQLIKTWWIPMYIFYSIDKNMVDTTMYIFYSIDKNMADTNICIFLD